MTQINKNAKALAAAVTAGVDPITVELNDGPYVAQNSRPKSQGKMDMIFGCSFLPAHITFSLRFI